VLFENELLIVQFEQDTLARHPKDDILSVLFEEEKWTEQDRSEEGD